MTIPVIPSNESVDGERAVRLRPGHIVRCGRFVNDSRPMNNDLTARLAREEAAITRHDPGLTIVATYQVM